jgi:hypothetical protein
MAINITLKIVNVTFENSDPKNEGNERHPDFLRSTTSKVVTMIDVPLIKG